MIPYTLAVCGIAWGAWAVSRGITLWAALPRLLGLVGVLLAVGGFLDLTGTSLISRILWPETYQSIGYFDPSYFAVTIVGMMLWLVGRLTARAFAKARELEEFV
ncbi:hypothetical protein [Aurantiacibacter gangjinensis]|nr:hypothetical protein [Aurantiacibacter gangjinensis]